MVHISMKLLLLICTTWLYGAAYCKQLSGTFNYTNTICKWTERKERKGPGPRWLRLNCDKTNPKLFCEYKGNPHPCPKYNKAQRQFYQCLADQLAEKGSLCTIDNVTSEKMCKKYNIVFTREKKPWLEIDLDEEEDGENGDDTKSTEEQNKEQEVNEVQQNKQNMEHGDL